MIRGDRLRKLREERSLSREELTNQLGLGANQIYRYETGENDATGRTIVKMSQFFGVTADYLLGLSDDRNPKYQKQTVELDLTEFFKLMESEPFQIYFQNLLKRAADIPPDETDESP